MPSAIPTKTINSVKKKVLANCTRQNVVVWFDNKNKNLDGVTEGEGSAYFVHEPIPTIAISSVGRTPTEVLLNLLHEDSHKDQWLEETAIWTDCFVDGTDVSALADLWANHHIELNSPQRKRVFDALFRLEMDAEIRTVEKIKKYKLDEYVDVNEYAKQAWAYCNSYKVTALCRKWLPANRPPYKIEEIVRSMPGILYNHKFTDTVMDPIYRWIAVYALNYPDIFPGSWYNWEVVPHIPHHCPLTTSKK
jgi:hypothetical protein